MESFDLIILGAGPGGVAAAVRGAQLGASVAVVEPDKWGGLCLNRACIPTKYLTTAAERLAEFKAAPNHGLVAGGEPALDPAALWKQKTELSEYFSMGTQGLLTSRGIKLYPTRGRLDGPGRVTLESGEALEASKAVIIACGGAWQRPELPGGDLAEVINSSQLMEGDGPPARTLFLGGGPWQLELAQFCVAAGGEAWVVEKERNILPGWDSDIAQRLRSIINQPPLTILNQAEVISLKKDGSGLEAVLLVKGEEMRLGVDKVVYVERRPALEGLGLETVGLEDLSVDQGQATPVPGLYAVGDAGGGGWSHLATAQGIVAAENALGGAFSVNPRAVPKLCYTRPQAASVGLSEAQAEDLDYEVITGEAPLGMSPMAMILGQSNGVIKVVGEERYGELLGVHFLTPLATELVGQGVLAIQMEATLEELARAVLPHPTIAESLAEACREALGWAIFQPG